jgi:hypothetical protein
VWLSCRTGPLPVPTDGDADVAGKQEKQPIELWRNRRSAEQ